MSEATKGGRKSQPQSPQRLEAARKFAIELAQLAANTRCSNVVVLDVSAQSPVTDFFVIGTGTSNRQMHSVAEAAIEFAEAQGYRPLATAGMDSSNAQWILADLVDVVFHVFSESSRSFYDLENLWAEARRVEWATETRK
jgi:ribosome-associated protein